MIDEVEMKYKKYTIKTKTDAEDIICAALNEAGISSLEIEDAEEIIYNQDLDDMSDVLVKLLKEAKDEADSTKRTK